MVDTITIDAEDSDNKVRHDGLKFTASPAMERANTAIEMALRCLQERRGDKRCIMKMRSHIKSLDLRPDRLLRLVQNAYSISWYAGDKSPDAPMPNRNCTNRCWNAAAWTVCRAAASVFAETVRPTSPSDFAHLLDVVQLMQGQLPLGPRAMRRFTRRMQIHLANILNGRRIDLGLLPPLNSVDLAKVEKAATYIPAPTGGNEATAVH